MVVAIGSGSGFDANIVLLLSLVLDLAYLLGACFVEFAGIPLYHWADNSSSVAINVVLVGCSFGSLFFSIKNNIIKLQRSTLYTAGRINTTPIFPYLP